MSKGNCTYNVVVYVGGMDSHDRRVIYTTSKESNANKFLHDYLQKNEDICKAYIERSFSRQDRRDAKRFREDDE